MSLHVAHDGRPAVVDDRNREVLLRGVAVNALADFWAHDPDLPTVFPFTDDDAAQMAAQGFGVVRLALSWSRLEPAPGRFDRAYVAEIRGAVDRAKRQGMYTVLDMHQDCWGKQVASDPGARRPPFTTVSQGWDGAPDWATHVDGMGRWCVAGKRELSPAVLQAFTSFWLDRDGIQTHFVRAWAHLAAEFAAEPAVAGYDLFNEPHPGWAPPVTSTVVLGRFYDRCITAIRAAERAAPRGLPHLVFVEPSIIWSGIGVDAVPLPGFTDDPDIVFAPHLYAESITFDAKLPKPVMTIERAWRAAAAVATAYGAPLWVGEWNYQSADPVADGDKLRRFTAAEDHHLAGDAWWQWRRACGDPHQAYTGLPAVANGYIRTACPSGESLGTPDVYRLPLTRAYPRAVPGRLRTLDSDPDTGSLTVSGSTTDRRAAADLWVPDRGGDEPGVSGLTRPRVKPVPGGWRVTGHVADDDYTITVSGQSRSHDQPES